MVIAKEPSSSQPGTCRICEHTGTSKKRMDDVKQAVTQWHAVMPVPAYSAACWNATHPLNVAAELHKTKSQAVSFEQDFVEGFCEKVGGEELSGHEMNLQVLATDLLTNPMMANVQMLHATMMFRILGDFDG